MPPLSTRRMLSDVAEAMHRGEKVLVAGLTWNHTRLARLALQPMLRGVTRSSTTQIELQSGGRVNFASSSNPHTLRGYDGRFFVQVVENERNGGEWEVYSRYRPDMLGRRPAPPPTTRFERIDDDVV